MEKLKKITRQLSIKEFSEIESAFIKNNSEKFLLLFKSYRTSDVEDEDLLVSLSCTENALYVLKSRLYDKIQKFLIERKGVKKIDFSKEQNPLGQYLYEYPREMAIAILHQFEKKYIDNDIPGELIGLYSVLKKAHYHSDKYYHYSQLYNKQVAYTIALEKAEDILLNFNKTLAIYFFSREEKDKEAINLLKREIKNIHALNQSHRIELINNVVLIQIQLFTDIEQDDDDDLEELIKKCELIVREYPNDKQIKYFNLVICYFRFEYYYKLRQFKKATKYFEIVSANSQTWLLLNNLCMSFKFLLSKIEMQKKLNKKQKPEKENREIYLDKYDFYTQIILKLSQGIIKFQNGEVKESIVVLNKILNEVSLINFFHIDAEVKFFLAFLYYKQNEYEKADHLLQSVTRKIIKENRRLVYQNATVFIRLLSLLMNKNKVSKNRIQETIQQFNMFNSKQRKLLSFLQSEIDGLSKRPVAN
jgi:hypothetical protein